MTSSRWLPRHPCGSRRSRSPRHQPSRSRWPDSAHRGIRADAAPWRAADVGGCRHPVHMDAPLLSGVVIACLVLGALAGWVLGIARTTARTTREHTELRARVAAAEATRHGVQAQLDHQQLLYRELAAQARSDQAAREERERREQSVLRAL